mgnify:CR=1 FL=1|tara:strand:+ start:755 stop:1405 length:651 start_codon:yes stop_codon:yes gene_type:complete
MNDLPTEIWDFIVKQNNETIYDKANELTLKELNDAMYKIQNIYERKRFDHKILMKKYLGDIIKIKYIETRDYTYKKEIKENLFVISKCCDSCIKIICVYQIPNNVYNETSLGFYTTIVPTKDYSMSRHIPYKNILNYEIISSKKDLDKKRREFIYNIGDIVSFYLYSDYYFWDNMDLENGKIERISNNYCYITLWGVNPKLHRVPKHHIIRKHTLI